LAKEIAAELRAMENSSTTSSGLNGGRRTLDKQTFALEAIQKFARLANTSAKGKLALIEITATETLYELTPEIESIKANAMNADNKYQPGDWVGGYLSPARSG